MKIKDTLALALVLAVMVLSACKNELQPEMTPDWDKPVFDYYYGLCRVNMNQKFDLQDLDVRFVCECTLEALKDRKGFDVLNAVAINPSHSEYDEVIRVMTEASKVCYQQYLR